MKLKHRRLTFVVIALQWKVWITALVITPLVLSATCFWAVNERILAGNEETRLDFMNANFVGAAQHSHLWYAAWLLIAVAVGMAGILLVSGNLP